MCHTHHLPHPTYRISTIADTAVCELNNLSHFAASCSRGCIARISVGQILRRHIQRNNKSTITYGIHADSAYVYVIVTVLSVSPHRNAASPNRKQTNPSRNGSDLSVLAPVTGLELTFALFAPFGNFKKIAV